MRKSYSPEFFKTYKEAFNLYENGNWPEAKTKFEEVLKIKDDKPSKLIMDYMSVTYYDVEPDW
jgi:outer membrane protein assembly factor BamD (BamD/ComL family)